METRLTPFRRFIADYQAFLVLGIAVAVVGTLFSTGEPKLSFTSMLLYGALLLCVVMALIAQYTARNRAKYLQTMKTGINQLGGQKFVDSFFRNMLSKMSMTDISTSFDKYIFQMSALMQRLGYKPSLLGK